MKGGNILEILVLVQDYPNENNKYAMNYVHTRNLEYIKDGLNVNVLSFNAKHFYQYETIPVYSYHDFQQKFRDKTFDLIISHAPNVRNHVRFLLQYKEQYKKLIFFIHGHEVMKMSKYYPKPYPFVRTKKHLQLFRDVYDQFKLFVLKRFISQQIRQNRLKIIFVSNWMRDVFLENIRLDPELIREHSYIIPNSMNNVFLENTYQPKEPFKADFVTIRPLDNSKYAIDVVVKLAQQHPDLSFHVYGKGDYFKYNKKPDNLEVIHEFLKPVDLAELLNHYTCALMPTRLDAQGVMMCEIASYGMPIVTSDLPICKEMLGNFNNVFFMNNETIDIDLKEVLSQIDLTDKSPNTKEVFSLDNTIYKEMEVIRSLLNKNVN
jgi:glycosyltransferase involved in cell wall biosynthesis